MKNKERQARINEILEEVHKRLWDIKDNRPQKNDIWDAYAKLEYVVILVKLDNDFETAGGFEYSKFGKAKANETEMLELAIDYLERGKKEFNKSSIKSAINDLRKARDALKLLVLKY